MRQLVRLFYDFLDLFFPSRCIHCGSILEPDEQFLCNNCKKDIPLTHVGDFEDNYISKIFWGRVPFKYGWSYMHYQKQAVPQSVLHSLKYRAKEDLAFYMGKVIGERMKQIGFPDDFDAFIPVPLHWIKLKMRGYNQSEILARGISQVYSKPVLANAVERIKHTQTQTKLSKEERWLNVQGIFRVKKPDILRGKHLVIIDDVLTTGSTIESLAQELLKVPGVKVSFITLATAKNI